MATRSWILVLILLMVLSLLARGVHDRFRRRLTLQPWLLFLAPAVLAGFFSAVAAWAGAFSLMLSSMVAVYLTLPTWLAFLQGPGPAKLPSALDCLIIAWLWLPIEFGAGAGLIPRAAQGFLHSVAYGIAILLALVLFLEFRGWQGMKYRVPASDRDLLYAAAGFAVSAPLLILVGRGLGFIPPWHAPAHPTAARWASQFLVILMGTGLPEELLFRSLIQNGLMQRYGATNAMLLLASFIFGCAHLDNGPQPVPNWRYMILATIAGFAYGKVFQRSSSIWGSAVLHATVDWTKHVFF